MATLTRRRTFALAAILSFTSIAHAQASPKPLHIIVAYPPGGASDVVARILAERFSTQTGRPTVVENKPGADGIIAMDTLTKAPDDGSAIAFAAISPFAITPHIRKLPYDVNDIKPLISVMYSPGLLITTSATKARTLKELLAAAKAAPGSIRWGNPGTVSVASLILEQLKATAKVDITAIPYKGGGQLVNDAIGGQFEVLLINSAPNVIDQAKSGALHILAVTAPQRLGLLPDVPTLAELGFPAANMYSTFGLFIPAKVPDAVAAQLNAEFNKIINTTEFRGRLFAMGNVALGGTPQELARTIARESVENARIIRSAGLRGE